jgi:hypothetical protein
MSLDKISQEIMSLAKKYCRSRIGAGKIVAARTPSEAGDSHKIILS